MARGGGDKDGNRRHIIGTFARRTNNSRWQENVLRLQLGRVRSKWRRATDVGKVGTCTRALDATNPMQPRREQETARPNDYGGRLLKSYSEQGEVREG